MRKRKPEISAGFWPGVSDAMLGALMMVLLIAMGGLLLFTMRPKAALPVDITAYLKDKIDSLEKRLVELRQENEQLKEEVKILKGDNLARKVSDLLDANKKLKYEVEMLKAENERLGQESKSLRKKAPPIIELTDMATISFELGSAALSTEFKELLKTKYFPDFLKVLHEYEIVDTIEIIGHTDKAAISKERGEGTLDRDLGNAIEGLRNADEIRPGSNADLGLMRSLAIKQYWKAWLASQQVGDRIRNIGIRTYSAAYAVPPSRMVSASRMTERQLLLESKIKNEELSKTSRRIEVRFTRLRQ